MGVAVGLVGRWDQVSQGDHVVGAGGAGHGGRLGGFRLDVHGGHGLGQDVIVLVEALSHLEFSFERLTKSC